MTTRPTRITGRLATRTQPAPAATTRRTSASDDRRGAARRDSGTVTATIHTSRAVAESTQTRPCSVSRSTSTRHPRTGSSAARSSKGLSRSAYLPMAWVSASGSHGAPPSRGRAESSTTRAATSLSVTCRPSASNRLDASLSRGARAKRVRTAPLR